MPLSKVPLEFNSNPFTCWKVQWGLHLYLHLLEWRCAKEHLPSVLDQIKFQSKFIAFVGFFGLCLLEGGRGGKRSLERKKGKDRKRGTDGCQQKLEPKAGDKLYFLNLLILKSVIAIVILLQQGQWGFRECQREKHFALLWPAWCSLEN